MNVSAVNNSSAMSVLESVLQAENARSGVQVSMLKKALDGEKSQGAAMVEMLDKCVPAVNDRSLDVHA